MSITKQLSIAAIGVDPNNANNVLAGIGWKDDYLFTGNFNLPQNANGEIFRTTDGGSNWTKVTFDTNSSTDRNVFTIQYDKNNSNVVYMGAAKGAFKSTDGGASWTKLTGPSGTYKNRGVYLSPDGQILYAAYTVESSSVKAKLYATKTNAINWKDITAGTGITLPSTNFWYPEVDGQSTGSSHKVIAAIEGERLGLYEGTLNWNYSANSVSYSWAQVWTTEDVTDGWDVGRPNCRFAHYTPNSAGWARGLWSTQNQTVYSGAPSGATYVWSNKYSYTDNAQIIYYYGTPVPTYSSGGTESTYTWI